MKTFQDRFAQDDQHHSFTLTADGCMSRMQDNTPYRENELENRIDRFARGAEADERMILNYVHVLAQRGLRPSSRETIEQFIIKHMDELTPQLSW